MLGHISDLGFCVKRSYYTFLNPSVLHHGSRCFRNSCNVHRPDRADRSSSNYRHAHVEGDSFHRREHNCDGNPLGGLVDELLPTG